MWGSGKWETVSQGRLVRRGLNLIRTYTGEFHNEKVRCRRLCSTKYLKLIGTTSNFHRRLNFTFSACTMPTILNRVEELFESNKTMGIDHSLGRHSHRTIGLDRGLAGRGNERPAMARLSGVLKVSYFTMSRLLGVSLPPISLATSSSSGRHRASIPIPSNRSTVRSGLTLRRILGTLPGGSRALVELECFGKLARDTATRGLKVSRIRISEGRETILTVVQGGLASSCSRSTA